MKPLVSVVTLTYKRFDLLFDTIDSVLKQAYENIEFIISDDGSDDFPSDIILDYINKNKRDNIKRIVILTAKDNQGTVKNANKAYRNAKGKYIVPLSCNDVFYDSNVVVKVVDYFETYHNNVLVTSRVVCNEEGKIVDYIPKKKNIPKIMKLDTPEKQHNAFLTNEYYNMASGCVLAVRKDFIANWGYFDERYVLWEDGPFFLEYTKKNFIVLNYDIISIKYDMGGVSNSGTNKLMHDDYVLYNKTQRIEDIKKYDFVTQQKLKYLVERDKVSNCIELLKLYFKYPRVMIDKIIYKIMTK